MHILWFRDIFGKDLPKVGGKAANLGEMYNLNLPVPQGFVITAQAYKEFLEENNLKKPIQEALEDLDVDNTIQLRNVSTRIQNLILEAELSAQLKKEILEAYDTLNVPIENLENISKDALLIIKAGRDFPFVAVRSSATAEDLPTASFAGQQQTFLNIRGPKNLVKAVQQCFASLFTPRAIFYREQHNFDHMKVYIAVIVQKMINSQKSGVIFTINPATNNPEEIIIEAGFGLGDAIVGGEIKPDYYILNKTDLRLKEKKINQQTWMYTRDEATDETKKVKLVKEKNQQVLKKDELLELGEYAKKLEQYYKRPQDIEFAIERDKVYIVQTRAVTTAHKKIKQVEELEGNILISGISASPGLAYGPVKIINTLEDLPKIQKGDILVTIMTNPDMVPEMKKVVAIVTDQGGMTCFEGSTKVLTNKGFMEIREAARRFLEGEEFYILSYDYRNLKPKWKKVVNAGKRISKVIRIAMSQKGVMEKNYLDLTSDHKMFTFKNRKLIKKEISSILVNNEMLCLIDSLPKIERFKNYKLAYLTGAILSDGYIHIVKYHTGNPRRGRITFTQKDEEYKRDFIETFNQYFYDVFEEKLNCREKISNSNIRGRSIQGIATDYYCSKLKPALALTKINQNLVEWCLQLDEVSCLNFLAGLVDGDGSFCNNRVHIYVSKEHILQGIIISCLKLGIVPQVTNNRNIYNIQILEGMDEILKFSRKIKKNPYKKILGTKLFATKQILGDIVDDLNYCGRIKPYVKNNLLIDSRKIKENILPIANQKIKNELNKILNSSVRMHRVNKIQEFGETEVFNLEVDAKNEMDHNYIVFSKRYTPLLVSNSHAAIVSRELGTPCIVGTEKATSILKDSQLITVDATNAKVYEGKVIPGQPSLKRTFEEIKEGEKIPKTKTRIYMNLGEPEKIDDYKNLQFDGIGLMRIEFIIASYIRKHPNYLIKIGQEQTYINKLAQGISKVAKIVYPKPVIVRFSDFKTNEYHDLEGGHEYEPKEENPMLGWRGVSRYISEDFKEAFRLECKAIKKVRQENNNVWIMLPFVRTTTEVKKCLQILKEENLQRSENFKIWLMAEVPSIALIPDEFAKLEIDGVSIGSNDLTQLVLGVDRDSAKLGKMGYFNEEDPAVLKAMQNIIKHFKEYQKTTSICGQAPSVYPEIVEFLVKQGIDSISVNPDAINKVRKKVSEVEKELI